MRHAIKALCMFLAALPLYAQTHVVPETDFRGLPTDSFLFNVKTGGPFNRNTVIRVPTCQDRTGATCAAGTFYVSPDGSAINFKMPPATSGGQRFRCQPPLVTTAAANQAVLQIAEQAFVPESLMVHLNGLLLSGATVGTFQADYSRANTTITVNRTMEAGAVLVVCYAYVG